VFRTQAIAPTNQSRPGPGGFVSPQNLFKMLAPKQRMIESSKHSTEHVEKRLQAAEFVVKAERP